MLQALNVRPPIAGTAFAILLHRYEFLENFVGDEVCMSRQSELLTARE